MRWRGRRRSSNIEDRRGVCVSGDGGSGGGGMLRLLPMRFKLLGVKGMAVHLACIGLQGLFTGHLGHLLSGFGLQQDTTVSRTEVPFRETPEEKEQVDCLAVIWAGTEDTWTALFQQMGASYTAPRLVLFREAVKSACGVAQSTVGPFYCPHDQQVYIDLTFYDQLKNQFNAPEDFAQAYVIAHEVGHHIQTLLGISEKVHAARGKLGPKDVLVIK